MVAQHLARAESVRPTAGLAEGALVALSLDHAYQAFETFLVRVERALGLPERSGSDWHPALLADAGAELPGLRPALFDATGERHWDHLRRFRHFLRHAYATELDGAELEKNVRHLREAVTGTEPGVRELLEALATSL